MRFELSSKKEKNGRRPFKMILYRIFPDDVIVDGKGTEYNENGITWIEEYCKAALSSINGMSLRCEFLDEDRTEICGHGETEERDDLPIFENASVIGFFNKGTIEELEIDGLKSKYCCGYGEIDEMCYKNFTEKLEQDLADGTAPHGSIEIYKLSKNKGITYLNDYEGKGRIPLGYIHSGYSLLGIRPSDSSARIMELNNKKEETQVDEKLLKQMFDNQCDAIINKISEINKFRKEENSKVDELNNDIKEKDEKINELNATVDSLNAALEEVKKERQEVYDKLDVLYKEEEQLKGKIAEAEIKDRIGELNSVIDEFTDDEKEYAKAEIEIFTANPIKSEINSVVSKIWEGIGKKAKQDAEKESARRISEQNSAKNDMNDIFGDVEMTSTSNKDDVNIFA